MVDAGSEAFFFGVVGAMIGAVAALGSAALVRLWRRPRGSYRHGGGAEVDLADLSSCSSLLADHRSERRSLGRRDTHDSLDSLESMQRCEYEGRVLLSVLRNAFDPVRIGAITRHGTAPVQVSRLQKVLGTAPRSSQAKINQDRGLVCYPWRGHTDRALACVFDGHGAQGEHIAEV
jgi:hypothetical protein